LCDGRKRRFGGYSRIQKSIRPKIAFKNSGGRDIYYRFYITHVFLGELFDLDDSNVCRYLKRIELLLAKNLAIRKDRSLSREDLVKIIVDVTEINVQRPKKNQKEKYSGKKKRHTSKTEVQNNVKGKIIDVPKLTGDENTIMPLGSLKNRGFVMQ
jgi:hypothetical protein